MVKSRILFLLSTAYLVFLSIAPANAKTADVMVEKMFSASGFQKIVADGYFKLEIAPQKSAAAYLETSTYRDNPIRITVHDNTLYLMAKYKYLPNMPQPTVKIKLAELKELIVYGPTKVTGSKIPTKGLKLVAQGYGSVDLTQVGSLNEIDQKGNNKITINGIDSKTLQLNADGFGKITLSGQAESLFARLKHATVLQAQNLRVENIRVQTTDNAQAFVHPTKSLRAFASEASTIYYYKQINDLTSQPIQSGNVLQMGW